MHQQPCGVGFVLACALGIGGGCVAPGTGAHRIEPTYDRATGRLQLLRYDADGDGSTDTWSHMDGARVVRIEIDTNRDATPDRWEYFDANGRLDKVGSSRAEDGTPDAWAYYNSDRSIARVELSNSRDGSIDRVEHYQSGLLVRSEEDTNGDGRIDKWESYVAQRLASVTFDTTYSGSPDRRILYGTDGTARVEAIQPAPAGPFKGNDR